MSLLTILSCKKETNKIETNDDKYCWQLIDPLGNPLDSVCNKNETDMQALYPNVCSYYKIGDEYCWLIDSNIFVPNVPEDYITRFLHCYGNFTNYQKVPCDYCQKWYSRQKNKYKPNDTFTFSPVHLQQYCGDTVHTLFQGREIILRETSDSLITLQFSNNGIF
jgi:hypothetical protein